jgi:multidrug transporter EmrE-like cation transporter
MAGEFEMRSIGGYLYILMTVLLTVYGQLVIKWRMNVAGPAPEAAVDKLLFVLRLLLTPWVLSGLAAALLAAVFWMATLTRFPLSYAYPFVAFTFVLVVGGGGLLFGEAIRWPTMVGLALIVTGITIASQG